MPQRHDDETTPLPAATPASPAEGAPAWATTPHPGVADAAAARPVPRADPTATLPPASAPSHADPAVADGTAVARRRWSGRRTAAVVAAALTVGVVGAVGAGAAVAQSDDQGRDGGFGRYAFPGGGRPDQGGLPGGGFQGRDRDHDHDRGRGGFGRGVPGQGVPGRGGFGQGAPGQGGSSDPRDANGSSSAPSSPTI